MIKGQHPKIGIPQEYKAEWFGRFIPTNYSNDSEYSLDVIDGNRFVSVERTYKGKRYISDGITWRPSAGFYNMIALPLIPYNPVGFPSSTKPTPEQIPFETENNPPWTFKMPWTFHVEIIGVCGLNEFILSTFQSRIASDKFVLVSIPKLNLMPIDSVTFTLKVLDTVCGEKTYLECLVYNVPNKEQPYKIWVEEKWLQPHTGKTSEEEANERIKSVVDKIRSKYRLKKK